MSLITPVVLIIYKRLGTTIRVFEKIKEVAPNRLYLIADGPKQETDKDHCLKVRTYVEENINWPCDLVKIYSEVNLGCAKRVQSGLDKVFENEEMAIILEDDTLPELSFFRFCDELLRYYKNNSRVAHISGCNPHSNALNLKESYCFSSIVNIWGWATWKRAWLNYDINMQSWENEDKESFLSHWCPDSKSREGIRKMFDLHCNNEDPWTWDYQWVYSCWKNNALSIIPKENIVSNLGIGPNATNTKSSVDIEIYPSTLGAISFPLRHPNITRNTDFETNYYRESQPPFIRRIKNRIKSFL